MEFAEVVRGFLQVLVWPFTVLTVAVLFRRSIRAALARLATLEGLGVRATLAEASAEAAQVTQSPYRKTGEREILPASDLRSAQRFVPESYIEARAFGAAFRSGQPVLVDLVSLPDEDAKRLVDFAAGLVFDAAGTISRVTDKTFLLTHAETGAEKKVPPTRSGQ